MVYGKSSGLSACPKPGRSYATARPKAPTAGTRSLQSSDDPGLPCTNTTASSAPGFPAWRSGERTPRTPTSVRGAAGGADMGGASVGLGAPASERVLGVDPHGVGDGGRRQEVAHADVAGAELVEQPCRFGVPRGGRVHQPL